MVKKTSGNNNLHKSRAGKTDEFYTQISLIEQELKHYKECFKDKVVYCNCDDPYISHFFLYFFNKFQQLGLKKLITTCYKNQNMDLFSQNDSERAIYLEYYGDKNGNNTPNPKEIGVKELKKDGDFRSKESIELLKQADIVVTNPPFSLFREYISQLIDFDKKFIVLGNQNAVTYREILPLFIDNKIWLGYNSGHFWFRVPDDYEVKETDFKIDEDGKKWRRMGNICWYTNIDVDKRHENMTLFRNYTPENYPKYDNYDAINVDKTVDIPCDYFGIMGVPITFIDKHNPEQFELLGDSRYHDGQDFSDDINVINGKNLYRRLLIRRSILND